MSLAAVPPNAPTDLSADEVTACSATFSWKAPSEDDDDVDEYIVEIRKQKSEKDYREVQRVPRNRLSTIIEELEGDEEYDVRVKAVNKAGASKDAAQLGFKTNKKQGN